MVRLILSRAGVPLKAYQPMPLSKAVETAHSSTLCVKEADLEQASEDLIPAEQPCMLEETLQETLKPHEPDAPQVPSC